MTPAFSQASAASPATRGVGTPVGQAGSGSVGQAGQANSIGGAQGVPSIGSPPSGPGTGVGKSPSQGASGPITLTLDNVVAIILGNNSNVVEARQRLEKAIEQINQLNAQEKPQVRGDAADTYNSYNATTVNLGPIVQNPVLPSGGAIPTVTDDAATTIGQISVSPQTTGAIAPGISNSNAFGASGSSGTASSGVLAPNSTITTPTTGASIGTGVNAPASGSSSPGTPSGLSPATNTGVGAVGNGNAPSTTSPATNSGPNSSTGAGVPPLGSAPQGSSSSGSSGNSSSSSFAHQTQTIGTPVADLPPILQTYIRASSGDQTLLSEAGQPPSQLAKAQNATVPRSAAATAATQNSSVTSDQVAAQTPEQSVVEGQRNTYEVLLEGSQYIDIFGYFNAARDVQYAVRDFYALDLERVLNETALTAKDAFFDVLFDQDEIDVDQEQVSYSTENLRIVTAQRQQGLAADYDVYTAQTALANAQQILTAAQNQYQLGLSQLAYLLGLNPDQQITLVPPALPSLTLSINVPYSIGVATRLRPEVQQARRNVDMARQLVKLAGDTLAPTLGIVGTAQYNSVTTQIEPRSLATISAQLGIPIDDGGATRSRVRSAQVDLQTQNLAFNALGLSVGLEVRQAALNVSTSQTEIAAAQTATVSAEEALRLANIRYRNGLGTFLDVTNALAQLATARNNLTDAQFAYGTALATLVRNEGGR